jgi:hypothetical protein
MNLEGLRCLALATEQPATAWRGAQLLKVAEQLCVVTALESKLLGRYVLGETQEEPVNVRRAVARWAIEATRRELDGE